MIHLLPLLTLLAPSQSAGTIVVDAGRGPVTVQVPASYDAAVPTPIVVLLHGYSGTGAGQEAYMQFGALADTYGFLYMYPDGLQDNFGFQYWNGTDACCDFLGTGVDDVGYLFDLLDLIRVQMNVDPARVHFIGHSNGGFMAHHLACDRAGEVASIASLAGATFFDPANCAAEEPVHVLQIHGTSDNTVFFGGGQFSGNPYPGAITTAESWAASNNCDIVADTSSPPINLVSSIPGPETTVWRYETACDVGGSAELWTIQGGGHVP
jgi:polyhydroxybutyrate depolymerase